MTSMIFKDNEIIREITQKEHHSVNRTVSGWSFSSIYASLPSHLGPTITGEGNKRIHPSDNQVPASWSPHHQWPLPSFQAAVHFQPQHSTPESTTHGIPFSRQGPAIPNPPASTEPFFLWSYFLPASIFQISLLLTNSALYLLTLGILCFPLHFGKLFKNYIQPNLPQWQKNNQARIIILLYRGESYFPLSLKEIITELLKYGHIFLTIQ